MPATRSRSSTEQPAEVAAEEVKQVHAEDGAEIVPQVPVPTEVAAVKAVAAETAVVPESDAPAAEPAVVPAVVADEVPVTNGSAEPVVAEQTNGSETTNGSAAAVVTNGSASEVAAQDESVPDVAAEPVSDGKRKSEVGDGDLVPDSSDVKKQKVVSEAADVAAAAADEPVVDAAV